MDGSKVRFLMEGPSWVEIRQSWWFQVEYCHPQREELGLGPNERLISDNERYNLSAGSTQFCRQAIAISTDLNNELFSATTTGLLLPNIGGYGHIYIFPHPNNLGRYFTAPADIIYIYRYYQVFACP